MKLKTKYLIFLLSALTASLAIFVFFTLKIYSQDKINFVREKASQDVVNIARQIAELTKTQGVNAIYGTSARQLFEKEDLSDKYLIHRDGNILISSNPAAQGGLITGILPESALNKINLIDFATGLVDSEGISGKALMISYANIPDTGYFLLQIYQYDQLNRFLSYFLIKVFFSFLAIAAFFFITGYFVIHRLTMSLDSLSHWAEKFGAGDLDVRASADGQDEVGVLSKQFNKMAARIKESLKMEEEKARLKLEVETAKKVQETLFLPGEFKNENLNLAAFYEPATECGGDWWYYFKRGEDIWICIGDVTGHGVGSAMLTSSVRSAMSIIEKQADLTPARVLEQLNQIIFETVSGNLNMTFFVAQLCPERSLLRYANASHEFPIVFPKGETLKKDNLQFITGNNGPRLGQALSSTYSNGEMALQGGCRLVFFSDGIYDVSNKEKKNFGERRFIKSILDANPIARGSVNLLDMILKDVAGWRGGVGSLADDVSLVCVDFQ